MNFEKRILADGQATLYRGDSLELLRAGVFGKIGAIVSDQLSLLSFHVTRLTKANQIRKIVCMLR